MDSLKIVPADFGLLVTSVRALAPSGHCTFNNSCLLWGDICGEVMWLDMTGKRLSCTDVDIIALDQHHTGLRQVEVS